MSPAPHTQRITLPQPYDGAGLMAFLNSRAIPGVEAVTETADGWEYARTLRLRHDAGALVVRIEDATAVCELTPRDQRDTSEGFQIARDLLDLDTDPSAVDEALSRDDRLRPLIAKSRGLRIPGAADPHELMVRAVLGQQISVVAASTMSGTIARTYGDPAPDLAIRPGLSHLFPTNAQIAAIDPIALRMPRRRAETIVGLGRAFEEGHAVLIRRPEDPAGLRRTLIALPGIGPWTADYVLMRGCGGRDILLVTDLIIRRAAQQLGLPGDERALTAYAERWSPWRGYANFHLWRAYLPPPRTRSST